MGKPARWILGTLVLGLVSCGSAGAPDGITDQGRQISDLWRVFLITGIAVAGIVYALIGWSVIRYRNREPATFRHNTLAEAFYLGIPIVIVIGLFALTFRVEQDIQRLAADPDVTVDVTAFKWSWRFDYAGTSVSVTGTPDDPPELVLPVDRTVRIVLDSSDVVHSFYVPDALFKRDAIPGRTTEFDLTLRETGSFLSRCAEFCGVDHVRMTFVLRTVPPDEFERWLATEAAS